MKKRIVLIGFVITLLGFMAVPFLHSQTRVEITPVGTVSKSLAVGVLDTTVTSTFPIDGSNLAFMVESTDSTTVIVKIAYVSPTGLVETIALASRPTVVDFSTQNQKVEFGDTVTKLPSQWMAKLYIITTNTKTAGTNAVTVKAYRVRTKS